MTFITSRKHSTTGCTLQTEESSSKLGRMNGLGSVVKVWRRRMWPSQRPRSPVISWTSLLFQACQHFLQRFQRLFSWKLHVWFVVGRELQAGYDPHNMFVQAWKNEKHWRGNQSADLFVKIWHLSPSFSLFYALKLNPKSVVAPSFWLEPLTRRGSHYWTVQNEMIREKWKRERLRRIAVRGSNQEKPTWK